MADSADLAASPNSSTRRAGSAQRRETTVSTETENKLARAARSAQRLAQLSDVPRDDSTFDLFPDDPTRATLEAMTIDVRQGTLTGFELPAEVQAAVGITDDGDALAGESKPTPTRRVTRAAKIDEATSLSKQASVLDERVEPSIGDATVDTTVPASAIVASAQGVHAGSNAVGLVVAEVDVVAEVATSADQDAGSQTSVPAEAANPTRNASAKRTGGSADAAAAVKSAAATQAASGQPAEARVAAPVIPAAPSASSAGLRQAVAARVNETASMSQPGASSSRLASTVAKAASAPRDASVSGESPASSDVAAAAATSSASGFTNAPRTSSPGFGAQTRPTSAGAASRSFGTPQTSSATNTAAPELDRARATAFADTVDALYGVIADQRRAATDHSRRMKWMLSIVVAALLVTVAIGITQTLLLMRLTRDSTAQQQRIEQMMLNQQATLSTLLDTDSATVSAPAIVPVAPAAPAADAPTKHPAVTRHAHKAKTKPAH